MAADTRDSRFDRHRMRQRGAGARDIKTQFGFSLALSADHALAERSGRGGSALSPHSEPLQCRDAIQKPTRKRKRAPDCAVAPLSELVNDSTVPESRSGRLSKSKRAQRRVVDRDDDENYNPAELAIKYPNPKVGRVGRPAKSRAATKVSKHHEGEASGKLHAASASQKDLDATEEKPEVETETYAPEPKPRRRGRPPKNAMCAIDIVEDAVKPESAPKTTKKRKTTTNVKTTIDMMTNDTSPKDSSGAKGQPPPPETQQASDKDSSQIPNHQPTRKVNILDVTQEHEFQITTADENSNDLKPPKSSKAPSKLQQLTKPAKPETSQPPTAPRALSIVQPQLDSNAPPPPPPPHQEKPQQTSNIAQQSHQRNHQQPSQSHQRTARPRAKPKPATADNEANDWAREDWFEASVPASLLRIAEATDGSAAGKAARLKFRF